MSLTKYTSCVKIVRTDSVILGLTELDKDITFESQLYQASVSYQPTTLQGTANLSVNNADTNGFLSISGIDRDDIVAGLYDHAQLFFFILDYDSNTKVRDLGTGWLGEVTLPGDEYIAEYRSLTQKLQQTIGRTYNAECDATLGDARCGINLASFTDTGTITSVTSNSVFIDTALIGTQSDNYYNYGLITFTSGLNNGLAREVKDYNDATGEITTLLPFPYTIEVSDTFTVYAGCDKVKSTCIDKFDNLNNAVSGGFRGHDLIPGQDQILKFGGK